MKFLGSLLFALSATLLLFPGGAEAQKVGLLNSQRILAEAPGFAEARKTLETEFTPLRTELETLERRLQEMQQSYEQQQGALSESARQTRQGEIQQAFTTAKSRTQEIQAQAERRQNELLQPLLARIEGVVEQVRATGGYSLILDTAAAGALIIKHDPAIDITDQVLARLKAQG